MKNSFKTLIICSIYHLCTIYLHHVRVEQCPYTWWRLKKACPYLIRQANDVTHVALSLSMGESFRFVLFTVFIFLP